MRVSFSRSIYLRNDNQEQIEIGTISTYYYNRLIDTLSESLGHIMDKSTILQLLEEVLLGYV